MKNSKKLGYGAARTSGMGLQDESIQPGKVQKAFLGKAIKKVKGIFGGRKSATMTAGGSGGSLTSVADLYQKALDNGRMIKPQKAALGLAFMKKAKDKGAKGAEFLSPMAMLKRVQGNKTGGVMKANEGEFIKRRKALRGVNPFSKIKSGLDLPVINSVKPAVHKTKRAQNLANYKIQFNKQRSRAGANPNSHFDKKNANVVKHTRVSGSPGASKFMERRLNLGGVDAKKYMKTIGVLPKVKHPFEKKGADKFTKLKTLGRVVGSSRVGKIALGVGTAGVAAQQYLKSKMNKKKDVKKKMGGGMMMQRPMGYKGGGMDTGRVGEMKSRIGVAINKAKRINKGMRLTDKDIEKAKSLVKGKMGGGMMKPKGYNHGGGIEVDTDILGKRFDKKFAKHALSKDSQFHAKDYDDGINIGEKRAMNEVMQESGLKFSEKPKKIIKKRPLQMDPRTRRELDERRKRSTQKAKRVVGRNIGGMTMMQQPIGFKSGTMVKARGCKLGRTRPTKIT